MKFRSRLFVVLALMLAITVMVAQQSDPAKVALEAARKKAVIDGDLNAAIKQYNAIAAKYAKTEPATAAMALFRMGELYQKQGDAQAQKVYERIVRDFPDQKELRAQAQAKLGRPPSSLVPTDDDSAAAKDSLRSILEGPRSRTPGDLRSAVFIVDITHDGHARGPVITLMEGPGFFFWAPAWSPDGETVQAKRKYPGEFREGIVLYSMTKREVKDAGGGPQQPNPWFHDSLHLLGYSEDRPIVNLLDVTQMRQESGNSFLKGGPFLRMDFPVAPNLMALSPDDKTLYLVPRPVLYGKEGRAAGLMGIPPGEPKNNKLTVVDVSTRTEKQRLTIPVADDVRELALSPDGRTLAMWTVADTRTEESRLFRVGVDGSGYRELYRGHGATLAWAQDGRSIFFGQSDKGYAYCLGCDHDWQVMRIPADGGKEQFTGLRVKGLQYISLSPDGKRLAFDGAAPTISETP